VIGLLEPQICQKMLKKLRAKFPATTPSWSMVKIGHLDDSSLNLFEPQASPGDGQSQQQKKKKNKDKKERGKKNSKVEKPKAVGHFLIQKLKILISAHAWTKMS